MEYQDLTAYLGKHVIATLEGGSVLSGIVIKADERWDGLSIDPQFSGGTPWVVPSNSVVDIIVVG